MSEVVSLRHDSIFANGSLRLYKHTFVNVAASQTDSQLIAAVTDRRLVVVSVVFMAGTTATTLTFNTKGSGAGTAISCAFSNDVNSGAVLGYNPAGWFKTKVGEALTVTTGAGSSTGIMLTYFESA